MHDEAAAGLLDGSLDRVDVERDQRTQINDFRIDPGLLGRRFGDMRHRAVGEHGDAPAFAPDRGLAERYDIAARRNLAQQMFRPRGDRLVGMARERAVVEPLRLQKDHRIVVLDRRDQEALGVVWVRGDHGLEAANMGEHRLRALAVRLTAVDAAAAGHTDDDRGEEIAPRTVAKPRRLRHELVIAGIDVVGELDLRDRPKPIGAHADRDAHDPGLVDWGVEAARLAILALQAIGAAEYAAEIADVLAEHDDALVLGHLAVHRVADRLDHRHSRHRARLPAAGAARANGAEFP